MVLPREVSEVRRGLLGAFLGRGVALPLLKASGVLCARSPSLRDSAPSRALLSRVNRVCWRQNFRARGERFVK